MPESPRDGERAVDAVLVKSVAPVGAAEVGAIDAVDLVPTALTGYGGGAEQLITQLTGVVAVGGYVIAVSAVAWLIIKAVMGLRVSAEEETEGLDIGEHGHEAYHGFQFTE